MKPKLRIAITAASFLLFSGVVVAEDSLVLSGGEVKKAMVVKARFGADLAVDGKTIAKKGDTLNASSITAGSLKSGVGHRTKFANGVVSIERVTQASVTGAKVGGGTIVPASGPETQMPAAVAVELIDSELADVVVESVVGEVVPAKPPAITSEAKDMPLAGDWFKFKVEMDRVRDAEPTPSGTPPVMLKAPKGACFRVASEMEEGTGADKKVYARGTFDRRDRFPWILPPYGCATEADLEKADIKPARPYLIQKDMILTERDRDRYGWTYGLLVAPFKYYRSTRTFDAGATVGPYLGYRMFDRQGASSVIAAGLGATSAKVRTQNADGSFTDETKTGVSIALAWISEFKNDFNVGLMVGRDLFTQSANVPNSGVNWISVSFGTRFD